MTATADLRHLLMARNTTNFEGGEHMSTKARYINPQHATGVAEALRTHGYTVTPDQCIGYAINVAEQADIHQQVHVLHIIDQALDGYYLDAEGIPATF